MKNKVYFVSFGPGDPELLTVRGYKILKKADVIVYPGSLIDENFLKEFNAIKINSFGKNLDEIIDIIMYYLKKGLNVARIVSGDASIFSAVKEQIDILEKNGVECEIVPGVSSVFASAAAIKTELTLPKISSGVAILRSRGKTLENDYIEEIAKTDLTIVILLSIDKIEEIARRIMKYRRKSTPVAVVYRVSRKDEKIIKGTLENIAEKVKASGIKKTAVIIIGDVVNPKFYERSFLYKSL